MTDPKSFVQAYRREYTSGSFDVAHLKDSPFVLFEEWLRLAIEVGLTDAPAFVLSTCGKDNLPSGRVVLLRGFDESGFVFYTNYGSAKAEEMAHNPQVGLTFYWHQLNRQVRISGNVRRISEEESDTYFASRPRSSQLSAWASLQSTEVESRQALDDALAKYDKEFSGKEVPRPESWGGYCVRPNVFEFWNGRENRMHDRFRYALDKNRKWAALRLAP